MLSGSANTREVMQLTGATARQLQWWDEHRLIRPARAGRKRLYSQADLAEILVVLELRRRHISLHRVRRVLRFLEKQLGARLADLVSDHSGQPLTDYHLLIDGKRLYLETEGHHIFELLRRSEQAVFLVSLTATVQRLRVAGNALIPAELCPAKKPARQGAASKVRKEREPPGRAASM